MSIPFGLRRKNDVLYGHKKALLLTEGNTQEPYLRPPADDCALD